MLSMLLHYGKKPDNSPQDNSQTKVPNASTAESSIRTENHVKKTGENTAESTHSAQTPAEKEGDQVEQAEGDSNEAASSAQNPAKDTAQSTGTPAEQKEEGSSKIIPTEQKEGDADQPTRSHAEQKRGASTEATVNPTRQKEEGSVTPTPAEQKEGDADQPTRTPDHRKEGDTSKSTSSAETTAEPKTSEPSNPLGSSSHTSREQEGDSYSSSSKPNKPAESHSNYFIKQRSSSDPSNSGERPVMSPVCLVEPIDGKKGGSVSKEVSIDVDKLRAENERLKQELRNERQGSSRRHEEIASSREFRLAYDKSHGNEAIQLVTSINDTSSILAEDLALNWDLSKEKMRPPPEMLRQRTSALDHALVRCPLDSHYAIRLLQSGFRICIINRVSIIMGQPCYGLDEMYGKIVQQLVDSVAKTDATQPTYARWRAITYDAILSDSSSSHQRMVPSLCQAIIEEVKQIGMLFTGRRLEKEEYTKLAHNIALEVRVGEIITKAFDFARMVNINIVSANYEHIYPIHGTTFNGEEMDLSTTSGDPENRDKVVATLALGLLRGERIIREGMGAIEHQRVAVVKAEVLTERDLRIMTSSMPDQLSL